MIAYLLYLTLSLTLITFGIYCFIRLIKTGKLHHTKPLAYYLGLSTFWIVVDTIETFVQNQSWLLFLDLLSNFVGFAAIGTFLLFLYHYLTGMKSTAIFYSLVGITNFFFLLRLTNSLHRFYYRDIRYQEVGPYLQLAAKPGPAYGIMVCLFAIVLIYVLFYVMTHRATIQRVFHLQLNLTIYSMTIFLLYSMFKAINLPLIYIPVMGQLGIIPGIIFCLYTFQKNMLHLQPISIEKPMEELMDGVLSFSGEGIIVDLNNQMCKILNKPWRKIAGHSLKESFPEFSAKLEEVGLFPTNIYDSRRIVSRFVFEFGKYGFDTHVYFSNRYIRVTMHDVSEFLKQVDKESSLAAHDPLTGVLNRRHSEQTIKELLSSKEFGDTPYCFIVFDIDFFKQINDNFGHQTGDVILKEITHLFTQSIRPADVFGRFGGDEFILLLHQVNQDQAVSILNRIQKSIKTHQFRSDDGEVVQPTISIGAITATTAAELPYDDLFYLADEALYQAKEKGRDQIVVRHHTSYTKATYL